MLMGEQPTAMKLSGRKISQSKAPTVRKKREGAYCSSCPGSRLAEWSFKTREISKPSPCWLTEHEKGSPAVSTGANSRHRGAIDTNDTGHAFKIDTQKCGEHALDVLALSLSFMVLVAALDGASVALVDLAASLRSGHGGDSEEDRGGSDEGEDASEHGD